MEKECLANNQLVLLCSSVYPSLTTIFTSPIRLCWRLSPHCRIVSMFIIYLFLYVSMGISQFTYYPVFSFIQCSPGLNKKIWLQNVNYGQPDHRLWTFPRWHASVLSELSQINMIKLYLSSLFLIDWSSLCLIESLHLCFLHLPA